MSNVLTREKKIKFLGKMQKQIRKTSLILYTERQENKSDIFAARLNDYHSRTLRGLLYTVLRIKQKYFSKY